MENAIKCSHILESVPVPILVASRSNLVQFANSLAEKKLHSRGKSLVGATVRRMTQPGTGPCVEISGSGARLSAPISHVATIDWDGAPATLIALRDQTSDEQSTAFTEMIEQAFTSLFATAGHGVAFVSLDGRWLRVNGALCEMVGYGAHELTGIHYQSMTHPDDIEPGRRYLEQIRTGEISTYQVHKRYLRKDGTELPAIVSVNLVRNPAGEPFRLVTHVVDATTQKQIETTVRTLMFAIDESPVGTLIADPAGKIVYANPAFAEVTQFRAQAGESMAREFLESGDMPPSFYTEMWSTVLSGSVWRKELKNRKKDGAPYWCDLTLVPVRGSSGDVRHVACFLTDISERKRAETTMIEANTRLQGVLDGVASGIVVMDLDGRIESFNPAASQMFGRSTDEIVGKNFDTLIEAAKTGSATSPGDGAAGRKWAVGRHDVTGRNNAGDDFPVELSISELELPDRKIAIAVLTDLTERMRSERQLQQAQKMEVVGQLTGGIAHDFNNLLGIVLGNLQLLQRRIGDDPLLNEFTDAATDAALRGAGLTKRLLGVSRGQDRNPVVLDANDLVNGTVLLMRRTLEESIEISTALQADPATVRADVVEFQSALLNLAINARDAMSGTGRLLIETSNAERGDTQLQHFPDARSGPHLCVSVTDTGPGIPDEVLPRIFEPFFTTKGNGKGSGLGLSMVYTFVRHSGGHILIDSEKGKGTRLSIFLPTVLEPREWEVPKGDEELPKGNETILLIEDDPKFLRMGTRLLEDLGYAVVSASDGSSAVTILRNLSGIDLLVTDMVLPGGMNGLEIAACARGIRPDIAILLTTGHPRRKISAGRNFPQLQKPYAGTDLANAVRRALDHAKKVTEGR